jgi:ribose transport system permease protein
MTWLRANIARVAPFAIVLFVAVVALIVEPGFYNPTNLRHVARGAAFLGVVALGQLMVLIVRGLDLSVGAVITATLLLVIEISRGGRVLLALGAVALMALAIGTLNATLVVVRRVPAILATLATLVLVQGVGLWFTGGQSRGRVPELIRPLGSGMVGPIPVPVLILVGLAVLVGLVLRRTAFGRQMYAVGSNPEASYLSGVPRRWVAGMAFVSCTVLAMIAGLMLSGYVGFYDRTLGVGYELDSIAAAILGGASFLGGAGTVMGTLAAVVGLAALDNLLLISGVASPVQMIGKGLVLFLAVLFGIWLSSRPAEATTTPPRPKQQQAQGAQT